jgi:16S rRNA (cytosine1402-N4)-methyltransferase
MARPVSGREGETTPLDLAEALAEAESRPVDWSKSFGHFTVMGAEAIEALTIKADGVYVDATLGGGGHSRLILERLGPKGRLIAVDQDPEPRAWAFDGWGKGETRLTVLAGNFENLPRLLAEEGIEKTDGLLVDLGLSSRQLARRGRGFSWVTDERLDMRLDPDGPLSAWEVVNRFSEKELADLIWRYGEERASRKLASAIVRHRPIETTDQLAALAAKVLYRPGPPPRIHPATRTFMALRIAVNRELEVLKNFLSQAPGLLKTGGRLAAISFHSLEDRLVKEAFRQRDDYGRCPWKPLYKKPLIAAEAEVAANPRSRSAKLRAAEKI